MSRWRLPPSATLRVCNPLQIAKIGSPRSIAFLTASSSQRSRSGFTSFSITDGSGTGWFKNWGATSAPPVSNNPSICSNGTSRRAAFQTLISGYFAKNGAKYFSSERRIQVAILRIPQIAVIPSEVEESRCANLKVTLRDPSTSLGMTVFKERRLPVADPGIGSLQTDPSINRRFGNRRSLGSTPQNNEDAGEKGDDSWNKAEVESKHCNQANENQINRQQKHSDVFVKGHGLMICRSCPMSRTKIMEQSRSGCFRAADYINGGLETAAPWFPIITPSIRERISLAGCQ